MGMFDSFYDADGREWQTKAFDCDLDVWRIGDEFLADRAGDFQVEVISGYRAIQGDPHSEYLLDRSLVTVAGGTVTAVPAERDPSLMLLAYSGGILEMGAKP